MKEQDIQGESMMKAYIEEREKVEKEGYEADWSQQVWDFIPKKGKFGFYHLDKGK